ncbi:MAG: tetratricopeptide repeat protein [Thermoanaerobaculia bacterium]
MWKSIALGMLICALAAGNLFAVGEARITGKVVGPDGKAIEDVSIKVRATEAKTFEETYKTDKNGRFTIFLLDGTIHYEFTFNKEGFSPYIETMKLKLLPEKNQREITLNKGGQSVAGGLTAGAATADPAVIAYNEGAALANEGNVAEAIAKLEEAIAIKNDLTAGYMALAKLYVRAENWTKAIEAANKVLEISSDEPDMFIVLAQAYDKAGNPIKAKEYRAKAPANPQALFNEAVPLINAGNDAAAEPLLRRAVEADDTFSEGHYELGMIYVRMGNTVEAKKHLNRYLELEPDGKDAPLAKEMLKYIQ